MEEVDQSSWKSAGVGRKYWKFFLVFILIIALVGGGFFIWTRYLSPEAKKERELQRNYEKATKAMNELETAMRNDAYGGKTPEETLKMFIEALKKEDIELASKYFSLRSDGSVDPKWLDGLRKTREAGQLKNVIDLLSRAEPDMGNRSSEYDFKFATREQGDLKAYVNMELNRYSGVWKIESL